MKNKIAQLKKQEEELRKDILIRETAEGMIYFQHKKVMKYVYITSITSIILMCCIPFQSLQADATVMISSLILAIISIIGLCFAEFYANYCLKTLEKKCNEIYSVVENNTEHYSFSEKIKYIENIFINEGHALSEKIEILKEDLGTVNKNSKQYVRIK